jgi:programmed cell death protein 4
MIVRCRQETAFSSLPIEMRKPGVRPEHLELPSEPLLNEEQRAALDAALAKKRLERDEPQLHGVPPELAASAAGAGAGSSKPQMGKNPFSESMKTKRDLAHDHHLSRRGKGNGRTKKSGAGGRYTWGKAGDPSETDGAAAASDRGDPNWDSEEEDMALAFAEERTIQIAAYKAAITCILQEYLNAGDVAEAAASLLELDHPEFGHYFVKKAITAALDRHDREREMISYLLSALYNDTISPQEVRRGFVDVVEALDDTILDVPDAVDLVATFICRSVADDVLPPAVVNRIDGAEGSAAAALRLKCEAHLADQHFAERMSRAWGHGAGFKLEETKTSIAAMLAEYVNSGDIEEVRRLLRDLAVPFFHHELVKQALVIGMAGSGPMEQVLKLLDELAGDSNDVSVSQITKGFQRVADSLSDIELDNPGACGLFNDTAVKAARKGNWLEENWSPTPTFSSTPGTPGASGSKVWANGRGAFHPTVKSFKNDALDIIREYFESGDVDEVGRRLTELEEPGFHNIAIKHAVQLAMDRKDREREMVSSMLPALSPNSISEDQMALGFTRLLAAADDLELDIPAAAHLLTLFLGRAIVDEVLPPKFLAEVVPQLPAGCLGIGVVQAAGAMLSARHSAERFSTCWHARGTSDADAISTAISELLKEFSAQNDRKEAVKCLRDLGAPHFHHELVYQAIIAAMDSESSTTSDGGSNNASNNKILGLLQELSESGEISSTQLRLGFDRVKAELEDLALDVKQAPVLLPKYESQANKQGWLSAA